MDTNSINLEDSSCGCYGNVKSKLCLVHQYFYDLADSIYSYRCDGVDDPSILKPNHFVTNLKKLQAFHDEILLYDYEVATEAVNTYFTTYQFNTAKMALTINSITNFLYSGRLIDYQAASNSLAEHDIAVVKHDL
jgi:hypothetical protein